MLFVKFLKNSVANFQFFLKKMQVGQLYLARYYMQRVIVRLTNGL